MLVRNQHDKQKRLAELLDYYDIFVEEECDGLSGIRGELGCREMIPDYFNDLNAAHELGEEMERRGLGSEWWEAICQVIGDRWPDRLDVLKITASQRAEAALEVLLKAAERANETAKESR